MKLVQTIHSNSVSALQTCIPIIPSRRSDAGRARIAHYDPNSAAGIAFWNLALELCPLVEHANIPDVGRHTPGIICLTSAERGAGRTLCAANLAIALAQRGRRVLLVDAETVEPMQRSVFHETDDAATTTGAAPILSTDIVGLDLLPARPAMRFASQLPPVSFDDIARLADLRFDHAGYDVVVVDAPSLHTGWCDAKSTAVNDDLLLIELSDGKESTFRAPRNVRHRVLFNRSADRRRHCRSGFASRFWVK